MDFDFSISQQLIHYLQSHLLELLMVQHGRILRTAEGEWLTYRSVTQRS